MFESKSTLEILRTRTVAHVYVHARMCTCILKAGGPGLCTECEFRQHLLAPDKLCIDALAHRCLRSCVHIHAYVCVRMCVCVCVNTTGKHPHGSAA